MSIKSLVFSALAVAAFAAPAQAQIWKRDGAVVVRQEDRVLSRSGTQTVYGVRCVDVRMDRYGTARTERVCDYDGDGVYGDADDRRIYDQRRRDSRYEYDRGVYRNRGQARAAEVHARNEARKREKEYEKRERELLRERQKREQDALKERQKRERERQKKGKGNGRW